ncbi:hypothetical protein BDP55DRAFT_20536 [Colletotrichum godetiae]|uniref:Uncharacterized protein n=1 Tax=Colletotrichum godetiae TaxID=1209918 RepID=A0AAJ0EZM2_9PEZI|nr:uncharacterized protein BDP55DRAFT_20536 [Colletotrichum godetiae]KAK1701429.1 hypothetical protein BDP55DRAFT_20536 [Colletotrichum godetiae]
MFVSQPCFLGINLVPAEKLSERKLLSGNGWKEKHGAVVVRAVSALSPFLPYSCCTRVARRVPRLQSRSLSQYLCDSEHKCRVILAL